MLIILYQSSYGKSEILEQELVSSDQLPILIGICYLTVNFPLHLMTAIKIAIFKLSNLCILKKRPPSNQPFVMGFIASLQSMTAFLQRQLGAGEGTRTPTDEPPDPKSGASANFATPACAFIL